MGPGSGRGICSSHMTTPTIDKSHPRLTAIFDYGTAAVVVGVSNAAGALACYFTMKLLGYSGGFIGAIGTYVLGRLVSVEFKKELRSFRRFRKNYRKGVPTKRRSF